jgi:glutathione gamma-glutamylcysteinyltransferase
VLVLNALAVDPRQHWKGPWRWYEESMLNCCVDLEQVKQTGITLRDFQCLALCQGLSVDLNICGDDNTTLEDFRAAVQRACVEENENENGDDDNDDKNNESPLEVLVVSYSRKIMKQTGSGHFSPIAAYDEPSDSVLILDTARFKYGAHWAKLPLLYDAMKPVDPSTGKPRGYSLLSFTPPDSEKANRNGVGDGVGDGDDETASIQPISRLFRSRMSQRGDREQYKQFLSSLTDEITLEQVTSYWTRDGLEPELIWRIVEPMRSPSDEEENRNVQNLLALFREMLAAAGGDPSCCASNLGQVPCVSSETAVYVVYLASLPEETRRGKVSSFESKASALTREHLLCDAEMLASAIDTSDQLTL